MRSDHARAMLAAIAVSIFSLPGQGAADVVFSSMSAPDISLDDAALSAEDASGDVVAWPQIPAADGTAPALVWQQLDPIHVGAAVEGPYTIGVPAVDYSRAFLDQVETAQGGADWKCLTEALYFEARGESVEGIFAVAEVILNRVDSSRFPATVCGVVRQGTGQKYRCQFSYRCDGLAEMVREQAAYRKVGKVARLMLDGAPRALTNGAQFYHTRAVSPRWSRVFDRTISIGAHHFYAQG